MQMKTKRHHYTPLRMAQVQNADNTKFWCRCGATRTLSFIADVNSNGTDALEDSLMVSYRKKHTLTMWPRKCALWYLSKGAENLCPHKNLCMDVYGSFIHNYQTLEVTKMSLSGWVAKSTALYPENGILFNTKQKWAMKPWSDMGTLNTYY